MNRQRHILGYVIPVCLIMSGFFSLQGVANAQCATGYVQVGQDCSARDAHNKRCKNNYTDTVAAASVSASVCVAACRDADCRKACGVSYSAAVAAASTKLALCRSRAPACIPICQKDPSHPKWWCQHWPYCAYSGGGSSD